ncbi:MAG: bifunctional phosphoglucose/phosphomannose isomerase [Flavobacteriales bacterium]
MKSLVEKFPAQLKKAIEIGKAANFKPAKNEIKNVLICGLGGSGIGGTIVSQIVKNEIKVPIITCNDYHIPAFVNENTLVIASSYSGNTEETLLTTEQAIKAKAEIAAVTTGGKILEICQKHGFNHIVNPGGMPPRSTMGYSVTQQLFILEKYGLISSKYTEQMAIAADLLLTEKENIIRDADALATKLLKKTPVIYCADNYEGIAIRFRQQINENSKMLSWHHKLPELCHNEIVGWTEAHKDIALVVFRNDDDFYRTAKRTDFTISKVKSLVDSVTEIYSKGNSMLEKAFYFVHFGDWVSVLIAEKRNIDPVEIKVIDELKDALAVLK